MRPAIPLFVLALALAACTMEGPDPQPGPEPVPTDLHTCGGDGLAGLIGQPASALPDHGGWSTLRVIRPGMMVTMDYSASRLNARVDGKDVILALSCG